MAGGRCIKDGYIHRSCVMLDLKYLSMKISGVEGDCLTGLQIDRKAIALGHTLNAAL